jgi:3-deoxy-D-arabino-heptulosonate 7-phosphate (DAHP) synthase
MPAALPAGRTLAKAAIVAGADGLIIEVHNDPSMPCPTARNP